MTKAVFRDVRMGSERWVDSARVKGTFRAVGAVQAGGKRSAGFPLSGRGAAGATQNGEDAVFPLRWGGGHCDRGGTGGFNQRLLTAHLLLFDLQERLLC